MKDMMPVLVLFGLMVWYFGSYQVKEYKPEVLRSISVRNVKEYARDL